MSFSVIFENFKNLSAGTDAFKQLKNECENALQAPNSSINQTALFLIYGFAKNYVLLYEDEAVESDFAQVAKQQLLNYMQTLNDALLNENTELLLLSQNQIIQHYMQSSRIF